MRDGSYKTLTLSEKGRIHCICFSPDGRHIAVGTSDGNVLLWNVRAGQLVERLVGHRNAVSALAFFPDGAGLVSGSYDGTVRFWNISSLRTDRSGLRDNMDVVNKTVWRSNQKVVVFTIVMYICTVTDLFFPIGRFHSCWCVIEWPLGDFSLAYWSYIYFGCS